MKVRVFVGRSTDLVRGIDLAAALDGPLLHEHFDGRPRGFHGMHGGDAGAGARGDGRGRRPSRARRLRVRGRRSGGPPQLVVVRVHRHWRGRQFLSRRAVRRRLATAWVPPHDVSDRKGPAGCRSGRGGGKPCAQSNCRAYGPRAPPELRGRVWDARACLEGRERSRGSGGLFFHRFRASGRGLGSQRVRGRSKSVRKQPPRR